MTHHPCVKDEQEALSDSVLPASERRKVEDRAKALGLRHESVLEEAARIVDGPRRQDYGTPLENHSCTAAMWTAYLRRRGGVDDPLTARDVCMLNILQKISRDAHSAKRDNLVDIAGYARNAELCEPDK